MSQRKHYTFSLDPEVITILRKQAEADNRSLSRQLEVYILEKEEQTNNNE